MDRWQFVCVRACLFFFFFFGGGGGSSLLNSSRIKQVLQWKPFDLHFFLCQFSCTLSKHLDITSGDKGTLYNAGFPMWTQGLEWDNWNTETHYQHVHYHAQSVCCIVWDVCLLTVHTIVMNLLMYENCDKNHIKPRPRSQEEEGRAGNGRYHPSKLTGLILDHTEHGLWGQYLKTITAPTTIFILRNWVELERLLFLLW